MQINIWLILSSIIIKQTLHASRGPWFTITDTFWVDYFLFFDHAFETFVKFKSIISGFVSWDFNLIKKRSTIVRSFRGSTLWTRGNFMSYSQNAYFCILCISRANSTSCQVSEFPYNWLVFMTSQVLRIFKVVYHLSTYCLFIQFHLLFLFRTLIGSLHCGKVVLIRNFFLLIHFIFLSRK